MPSLLSKFTKHPNGSHKAADEDHNTTQAIHRRAATSIAPSSSSSSTWSNSNPRLVLTSDSNESLDRRPPSLASMHRVDSLAQDMTTPVEQNRSIYSKDDEGHARRAFADRMREGNRRALSLGTQPEAAALDADELTPSATTNTHHHHTRPTRPLPEEPATQSESSITPLISPENKRSQISVTLPSLDNSSVSVVSDRHHPFLDSPPPTGQQGIVASPTSDEGHTLITGSPPPAPPKEKKSWRRRDSVSSQKSAKSKRKIHPSGGLASAIAGSGLALANPAMQRQIVPPVPPAPPPRSQQTNSELPPRKNRHATYGGSRTSSLSLPPGQKGIPDDNEVNDSDSEEESEDEDDSSPDELDLTDGAAPITGFAVASNKRTADFHALFTTVPEGDYLIDDYGCALQREILIQGRLYISENHICFHANIFGWTTDVCSPFPCS